MSTEILSILISGLALGTSIFTFYWTSILEKRALYFVPINRIDDFNKLTFALINGGTKDILITGLSSYFEGPIEGGRFYPSSKITCGDATNDLLQAGKAIECKVEFTEPFLSAFAQSGTKQDPWENLFSHRVGIDINWIEISGVTHRAFVLHSRFGFDNEGNVRGKAPASATSAKYELFAHST